MFAWQGRLATKRNRARDRLIMKSNPHPNQGWSKDGEIGSSMGRADDFTDEAGLRFHLTDALLDNMAIWLDRLGNPAWVRGRVVGRESGEVTCGAAFVHREVDGCMHISFFEIAERGAHRVGDVWVLDLYRAGESNSQEVPTIALAKAVSFTDPLSAKPMDPFDFSCMGQRTSPRLPAADFSQPD